MVARRNTALLGQALVGALVAAFAGSTLLAPFSAASAVLGVVLAAAVSVAGLALLFELLMLPFRASAIGVSVPRIIQPWVVLGILGSASVISGVLGRGIPGEMAIVLMRIGTPVAFVASIFIFARSRSAS